jgi:hypothetical protein
VISLDDLEEASIGEGQLELDPVCLFIEKRVLGRFVIYSEMSAKVQVNIRMDGFGACAEGKENSIFDLIRHQGEDRGPFMLDKETIKVDKVHGVRDLVFSFDDDVTFILAQI